MSELQNIFAMALLVGGGLLVLAGSIGLIRLPDFYSRSHAAGKTDTLGLVVILAGLMVLEGLNLQSAKLALVGVFACLANPVAVHALARAAYRFGVRPRLGPQDGRE